ncbi:MAG TPA: Stp1/IreP family PP2C-type Ser/Thr phosphatase [Candidatus Avoscillospira avistercoris]|uniref:Stp1/IreP family PP2C-type Ser/Thr phosphatase n=1 Tax=Candidatus Avoscillospira avistercoris TaxID=2840707 RepID=A0A9D1F8D5_9FIRM|nr:Stp1/IreP family PP2C-type Ser/Thr phosphatase [Candidatus Avoscillospira avistercoris]
MDAWGLTDLGNVRKQNQDFYDIVTLHPNQLLLVVCDGMGGAKSGNVASRLATEVFVGEVRRTAREDMDVEQIEKMLRDAVSLANQAVFEQSKVSSDFTGMGTTLVAAVLLPDRAIIANVGDSRAYIFDKDGIRFMTVDHSLVELMVRRGEITREQAKTHPSKNLITRAVGTEANVDCDLYNQELHPGDAVLLCSDGLSNEMADQEILFEVVHGVQKEGCCQRLLDIAKGRGAPDNVTVVLATV